MADDPQIQWHLANTHGIWMSWNHEGWSPDHAESPADQWNAGRATDVLVRNDGNLVVASANGGIWLISEGSTVCVSDQWEDSAFNALAQGPDDDQHIFAGGENAALYMTDLSRLSPMLDWIRLDSLRKMEGVGLIRDILVLPRSRVIVLACDGGIFWSFIGPSPVKFGPPAADNFHWRLAIVEGDLTGGFYSLAESTPIPGEQRHPVPGEPILQTLMAGGLGGDANPKGLFWGTWDKPDRLVLRRSHIFNQSADVTLIDATISLSVVASYAADPSIGYAACIASYSDFILFLAKTGDGGRSWNVVDTKVIGLDKKKNLGDALGSAQGGHNLCLAVSNTDSSIITLGFRNGAISFDGGIHWQLPGFDPTEQISTTEHIHPDLTSFVFERSTGGQSIPPEAYFVSSDGGVARVAWGDGAWFIESDRVEDGEHGNFYAVILDESKLVLHVRKNGSAGLPWQVEAVITNKATGRGCIIQSSFRTGDSNNGNLEVVVPEGNELVHYSCPIQNGQYTNWGGRGVITHLSTGPGCLIQSDFGTGSNGNLEVIALEGADLVHYWQDSANTSAGWHLAEKITGNATGAGCLIQSDFGSGRHGNLEVIVQEDPFLVHYWHDSSTLKSPWNGPSVVHPADSAGCFFQSDYAADDASGNFELVFRRGSQLMWSFRDNNDPSFPWSSPQAITAPGRNASGPGCVFQGNYSSGDHGNFELLVSEGPGISHYFRNNGQPGNLWIPTVTVLESAFTFRSDFNKNLPTLQFFPTFGGSMVADLALAGPLQDNGTVDGVAGLDGTPWFQLEGGDGQAAFYLSGHSPRIAGNMVAGFTAVHQNNEEAEDHADAGSKSAHLQLSARKLVLDDHGKGSSVIHLLLPKPGVVPVPDPAKGLRRSGGPGFLYEMVRSPENFPKDMMLAALAAQEKDLYVLLTGQDVGEPRRTTALDMHWEFQHTFDNAINAMASADGLTAIVELAGAAASKFLLTPGPNFWRLDLSTGNTVAMPVASADSGSAQSIAIVSPNEAYAAVTLLDAGVLGGPQTKFQIMCWDGKQWSVRGNPSLGTGEGPFLAITVDPTQTPATIFAATANKVYISRDSSQSWLRASNGLPVAVRAHGGPGRILQWVRDSTGSHVYYATFGRSIWSITTRETW